MTVPDAGTLWHPQFFCPVIFESQRSTYDSPMVYPNHALWHGDVRIGEPRLSRPLSFGRGARTLKTKLCVSWVVSDRLFEDWMATYHPPRITGCSPFAVKKPALRSPSRPASVRTLKAKQDVPSRRLATTTRTSWPTNIHLVLLKRSIAHHPSASRRSDSFG